MPPNGKSGQINLPFYSHIRNNASKVINHQYFDRLRHLYIYGKLGDGVSYCFTNINIDPGKPAAEVSQT